MNDCIFCKIVNGLAQSWKVYETPSVYAFFDIHPVNEYHTLVIPKKHYRDIFDLPEAELGDLISAVKHFVTLYHDRLGIENVQIINSSGAEAQQDVFHIHFHIVPRHKGDMQDIHWSPHPELRERFDELLSRLR